MTEPSIQRSHSDGVDILRMQHGRANALDLEFLGALRKELERDAPALVMTGVGRIFSAGVDLKRLLDEGDSYADAFLDALDACFRELFCADYPVVACVNGHAIAGGAILAMACDVSVAADDERCRFGVPELVVGVPFPAMAMEILRERAATSTYAKLLYAGETVSLPAAVSDGILDEVVERDACELRSIERARAMASIARGSFRETKRALRRPAMTNYRAAMQHEAELRAVWKSAECRDAIRAYVDRTLNKGSK